MDKNLNPLPRHFYSLDAARGLAALAVVFWHWHGFYFKGTTLEPFDHERQPLYFIFKPLYLYGGTAVAFFFSLSGFIFFWLYSDKIGRGKTSLKEFASLRFSRLYPLHFVTLLLVAGLQQILLHCYGSYYVCPNNDLYHFALQLGFASNWGLERGFSFNGPIWSVSVEVLLYAVFFLICKLDLRRWWQLLLYSCLGYMLMRIGRVNFVGQGVFSFFMGALAYRVFDRLRRRNLSRIAVTTLGLGALLLWIVVPMNVYYDALYRIYRAMLWNPHLDFHGRDLAGRAIALLSLYSFEVLLFPATIVALALVETHRGTFGKRVAFLGHLSYSSYLLHFPLQLIFIAVAIRLGIQSYFFYSTWSLILFFAILVPLSLASFLYFEYPVQTFLRRRLLPPRKGNAAP